MIHINDLINSSRSGSIYADDTVIVSSENTVSDAVTSSNDVLSTVEFV